MTHITAATNNANTITNTTGTTAASTTTNTAPAVTTPAAARVTATTNAPTTATSNTNTAIQFPFVHHYFDTHAFNRWSNTQRWQCWEA